MKRNLSSAITTEIQLSDDTVRQQICDVQYYFGVSEGGNNLHRTYRTCTGSAVGL